MSTLRSDVLKIELSPFALDVQRGLGGAGQKTLPSTYLYDAIGSALFDVITLLPEYGLTRADERVLRLCAPELASILNGQLSVIELGSGSGRKTRHILEALGPRCSAYYPIDVSSAALETCARELNSVADVKPLQGSYLEGLSRASISIDGPTLVLFLGSTIGNFGSVEAADFLREVRAWLSPGDALLLGADLLKPVDRMLAAYNDPLGVTASFNLNLLGRVNRELGGEFDLTTFAHEARWTPGAQRIEMHLRSLQTQVVTAARGLFHFKEGETIWTESSHKFAIEDLDALAARSGWTSAKTWVDSEWAFANCLWRS